ncbi:MAG: APC family permease [Candidatus Eremiobacteraeota bacterium]|nr:APC family permease [Candidatus Eremiobacteraeota bacterium]
MSSSEPSASPKFGLTSLSCLVVANTIGAGIYTTSAFTLADLGTREAVMAVWVAASVLALTGAYSFGVLARAIPKSGGEYLYLSRLIHPGAGFIAGWVSMIAAFAGAEAYAAITLKEYIQLDPKVEMAIAVGLLVLLALLHGALVRAGTLLQNLTVIAKGLFILLFVLLAAAVGEPPTDAPAPPDLDLWVWPVNLMWVSLSFTGFNSAIYVAEEAENPRIDVPRALLIGTLVTAVLYLLINAAMLYSAPVSELAGVPDIALVSAQALGGAGLRTAMQALVLLSLFTLISGMAVAGPRVVVKMGEDGFLPPMNLQSAALVQCGLAVFMTVFSNLVEQLTYLSLTLSLTSALAVAAVFRLPSEQRGNPLIPAIYITGTLLSALASLKTQAGVGVAALATIGSGALVYAVFFARSRPGSPSSVRED